MDIHTFYSEAIIAFACVASARDILRWRTTTSTRRGHTGQTVKDQRSEPFCAFCTHRELFVALLLLHCMCWDHQLFYLFLFKEPRNQIKCPLIEACWPLITWLIGLCSCKSQVEKEACWPESIYFRFLVLFYVEFGCSPWVCVSCLSRFWRPWVQ